jgi:predicted phosphohydrolase
VKIQVLADLHNEFEVRAIARTDADVVVLAGDTDIGAEGIEWVAKQFPDCPVVFVAGNHEFYGRELGITLTQIRAAAHGTNVHVLENDAFVVQNVRLLGCTLWTDFDLFGADASERDCMREAEQALNDYRVIRIGPTVRRLRAADTRALHVESRSWLEAQLATAHDGPTVIVTHHAPSARSSPAIYARELTSAAFSSNLEGLMLSYQPGLWIHGHTHHCVDYLIAATRIVSNQRGYPNEQVPGFRDDLVIEVGDG